MINGIYKIYINNVNEKVKKYYSFVKKINEG